MDESTTARILAKELYRIQITNREGVLHEFCAHMNPRDIWTLNVTAQIQENGGG